MTNSDILDTLNLCALLMELHEENEFKIRAYYSAVFNLEKVNEPLATMSLTELRQLKGIGKSIAEKIDQLNQTGSFTELDELLEKTPSGLLQILKIKGIGAKKVAVLWKELHITTPEELYQACQDNKVAQLKGFGEKTQEIIKNGLLFISLSSDKLLYIEAEVFNNKLADLLENFQAMVTGEFRRRLEIIDTLQWVVASKEPTQVHDHLNKQDFLEQFPEQSSPFSWRGKFKSNPLKVEVFISPPEKFINEVFAFSASTGHLRHISPSGKTLLQLAQGQPYTSEQQIYQAASLPYFEPELREGLFEFNWITETQKDLPTLIKASDLKGVLHVHSTYSDGKHTLREMALYAQELGYEYLGITDHSQSAFYASGLSAGRVIEQHQEIDQLNQELAPFKIFKGIESDILTDGSLDYPEEMLQKFEFVIASVHSVLNMSQVKATERIIKAIENPYTTILGHPTGRLLLRREGYLLDLNKVIDACAANGVIIEINAHPLRLDLDWRWVYKALEKNVMIAINPDAHEKKGYHVTEYGVLMGRKAGLTPSQCLNALNTTDIQKFFERK